MTRYVRDELIGKGAYKTVYKAFDEIEGIEVAWNQIHISSPSPEAELQRLYSQFHIVKSLKHHNVIRFYNSWIDHQTNTLNIITELFTSGSLRQYRKKHKKVDIKAVRGWARQILTGLNYLHTHNPPIIHRDLKCDNIFINGNHGEVKIGDLGFVPEGPSNTNGNTTTPAFMAPELCRGGEEYDELVDIYSFGMCLLEMVTFEYPYTECVDSEEIYDKVLSGVKPASLSKVMDLEVMVFIEKCLVPAKERLSAKELLEDIFLLMDDGNRSVEIHMRGGTPKLSVVLGDSVVVVGRSSEMSSSVVVHDDVVDSDSQPPVITFAENGVCESHEPCVEISMDMVNIKLRIKGELNDNENVTLILKITELQHGHAVRSETVEFAYYIDNDTPLFLASDLVDHQKLSHQYDMCIAQLIDLSLLALLPDWKPSVPINHLNISNAPAKVKLEMLSTQERDRRFSIVSFSNLFEAIDISDDPSPLASTSVQASLPPTREPPDRGNPSEVACHGEFAFLNEAAPEDRGSDMPCVAAISNEGNHFECPTSSCVAPVSAEYNSYDMENRDGRAFSGVKIGAGSNEKNYEQMSRELDQIELQCQQAMKEAMKEISVKTHESIMAVKKRFSHMKSIR